MATIKLDETITIALSVADRQVSTAWYEKHLGFQLLFDAEEMGWSEMSTNTPGVTLGFGDSIEAKPGNSVPVFGVSDADEAYQALSAAGVKFDGEVMAYEGMVKLATFFDPDNNALMIAEDLSKS